MSDEIVRTGRAEATPEELDEDKYAIIKGMLMRGDRQSDIAAFFKVNGRVVSHVNTGRYPDFAHVAALPSDKLPPADYPSPYELMEAQRGLWKARVALEAAMIEIRRGIEAVHKAEAHGPIQKMSGSK